ncbi:hypothetical protein C8Q72DRAFT_353543 [Fomitopsis betulina]|nr:hypothetical protein C8Q72DRAFT_353543 [Fomitopsis betulina]
MARNKDRKHKHLVDSKEDALKIAQAVAVTQEDKSKQRAERHMQRAETAAIASNPSKKSRSRDKLKQVKTALAEEAAKAKREKAKARKQAKAGNHDVATNKAGGPPRDKARQTDTTTRPRKRVSFAS